MPYIGKDTLRKSLELLKKQYSPLVMVSLPCMLAKKIPTSKNGAEAEAADFRFGSNDERQWLDSYFRPPGAPSERPYYMPATGEWVQARYPDRALQRRRTDFEGIAFFHPTQQTWALMPNAADALKSRVIGAAGAVPLAALMAWMWRERDLPSVEEGLKQFIAEMGIDRDGLLGNVYSNAVPAELKAAPLVQHPLTQADIADIIGGAPPAPTISALGDVIASVEASLEKQHVVCPAGIVPRILGGWIVGDVVVLVGPPGSGKTYLATALGNSLEALVGKERYVDAFIEVNRDFDLSQFLGYQNLSGTFTLGRFSEEVLLQGELTDPRLVVLDEWNLAQIDSYFAPILSVIETDKPLRLPGKVEVDQLPNSGEVVRAHPELASGVCSLPPDTFFIATCNSWAAEPDTRLPLSGPVKRRCRIIPMPNILEAALKASGVDGIIEVCNRILKQESAKITTRRQGGRASMWDAHRDARLKAIPDAGKLPEDARQKLLQLSRLMLENENTRHTYTVGILRDVLLSCVYAQAGQELVALGQQVADKVIHQVYGDPKVLESIVEVCAGLSNLAEIRELATRMGAFAAERRVRPLL